MAHEEWRRTNGNEHEKTRAHLTALATRTANRRATAAAHPFAEEHARLVRKAEGETVKSSVPRSSLLQSGMVSETFSARAYAGEIGISGLLQRTAA